MTKKKRGKDQLPKQEPVRELAKVEKLSRDRVPFKLTKKEGEENPSLEWADPNRKSIDEFKDVFGTKDEDLLNHILITTMNALNFKAAEQAGNVAIQSLYDQKPKDAVEARLISQAAALYSQGMNYLAKADRTERYELMTLYGNLAIKSLRLHNETIEALNRYRRGGEQRVIVQHVNVNDGGQAIVGHVSTGGGSLLENGGKNPCSGSAGQRPDQMVIDHAVSQQWQTGNVDCTADCVPVQKRPKESNG